MNIQTCTQLDCPQPQKSPPVPPINKGEQGKDLKCVVVVMISCMFHDIYK